jgi:AraC-like DNA-binding protein
MYLEIESVTYGTSRSFASSVFEGPRFICPYHRHPEFELVAIDGGRGRLVAGDFTGTFHEGDLYFLGGDLPHIFQNSALKSASRKQSKSLVIQFRPDFAGDALFGIPEFRSIRRILNHSRRGLKVTGGSRARVREQMTAVHESQGPRRVIELLSLLSNLAGSRSLRPLAGSDYDISEALADGRMSKVMAYIQENFTGVLTVPEAARRAGLTPNAFCRYFKQQTRRTFTGLITELRIGEACRLLNETQASVTEICYASGFGNPAHFYTEFKNSTGFSPLKFRTRLGAL